MSVYHLTFPDCPTVLLCLCLSSLLLIAVYHFWHSWTIPTPGAHNEKTSIDATSPQLAIINFTAELPKWFWNWRLEGLPLSLPISFSMRDNEHIGSVIGKGIGVDSQMMKMNWQAHQLRPGFERPREHPRLSSPFEKPISSLQYPPFTNRMCHYPWQN
jgi:hypothetical protein